MTQLPRFPFPIPFPAKSLRPVLLALVLVIGWTLPAVAIDPPANTVATPADGQVTVSWNSVGGATSYTVYRASISSGPYTALAPGLAATIHVDSTVVNDTTYYYVVTADDGSGESGYSNEDSATPRDGTYVSGIIGGTSAMTTTWDLAGSPYVVMADVQVRGTYNSNGSICTSTLVIESGVEVLFEPSTRLQIGDDPSFY